VGESARNLGRGTRQKFALRGLARRSALRCRAQTLDKTVVGPLEIPVDADVLTLLPRLFKAEFGATETTTANCAAK